MSSLISYDSENRIRILDPALFAQLEGIVNESSSFTSSTPRRACIALGYAELMV